MRLKSADEVSAEELGFVDTIDIDPSDLKVEKIWSNAFWETDLERTVSDGGFDLLVLAGQAAEHCVVFTYNGAIEHGHTPVLLQRGVLSHKSDRVQHLFEDRHSISCTALESIVEGASGAQ